MHSKPLTESHGAVWVCKRTGEALSLDEQRAGCHKHMWIPNLVGADYMPERSTQDATAYRAGIIDFYNGVGPEDGEYYYSSAEMRELSKVRFDTQMMIDSEKIRAEFPGSQIDNMDERTEPF